VTVNRDGNAKSVNASGKNETPLVHPETDTRPDLIYNRFLRFGTHINLD
jgi:hypothetical protein